MTKLDRTALWSLEQYAEVRDDFRAQVMDHKRHRRVAVSPHATLYFEDHLTMKYQVQEMLRTERVFEAAGIEEELEAYNPLIPDGTNLKATFMIEYADADERREALGKLVGVENTFWLQAGNLPHNRAIANEDLERSTADKTSAVHFLRFELDSASIAALKDGAALQIGVEHPALAATVTLNESQRKSLVGDLD